MGLLDTKIEYEKGIGLITTKLEALTEDEKKCINTWLLDITEGSGFFYDIQTIAKKLLDFLDSQSDNIKIGAIAKFYLICILRKHDYHQDFCYRNLEEGSIKKGFDGLYTRGRDIWLAESKLSSTLAKHRNEHQHTIKLAYDGIKKLIEGQQKTTPGLMR